MTDIKISEYDDIINHPHHISDHHPQMSMENRAAQFSPFAALTGYGDVVKETARLTDREMELTEDEKADLDYKLSLACGMPGSRPTITLSYFVPDQRKKGGSYRTISGRIKKIDTVRQQIVMDGGEKIDIGQVIDIEIPDYV